MENTERFEQLLRTSPYHELSAEDKNWVSQFVGSEEEYEAMRQATIILEKHDAASIQPDPAVLKSLRKAWDAKRSPALSANRFGWSLPAYAAIPAFFLVGVICWWIGRSWNKDTIYVDRMVTRVDTIRVASKPDTVVIERVVYKSVNIPSMTATTATKQSEVSPMVNRGVNMKEKEELEKLLVSGGF